MQPTILALIGKPLAGKDTQADAFVAAHPDAVKISTGHILRAVQEEGETHRFWPLISPHLQDLVDGKKLPDAPILAMLGHVMQEQIAEGKKYLVVAGSPRSMDQLEGFEQIAKETGARLICVHLDARDAETYARSATRNEGRADDTPQIHAVRLEEFRTHVLPVINKLRDEYRLVELNGEQTVEHVANRLENEMQLMTYQPEVSLPPMARR
jgi:adenylate kinase